MDYILIVVGVMVDRLHELNADLTLNRFSSGYLLDEKGLGTKTWIS